LGRASPTTAVKEIMTSPVVYTHSDQAIEECMALVTEKRVRHLPVMDEGKLVGLISIGDLVKSIIADQKFIIEQLVRYISG
jgi:CBS domain-containing protein